MDTVAGIDARGEDRDKSVNDVWLFGNDTIVGYWYTVTVWVDLFERYGSIAFEIFEHINDILFLWCLGT